jgi:hypothetical protein
VEEAGTSLKRREINVNTRALVIIVLVAVANRLLNV